MTATAPPSPLTLRGRRALGALLGCALGAVALYLGLGFWGGWSDVVQALGRLGAWLLIGPPIAVVVQLVRFGRWRWLLAAACARVPWHAGLQVFLAGLALTPTPARIGENLRSVLLLRHGVPLGTSLVVFFVERLCDLVAVSLIVAVGRSSALAWALCAAAIAGALVLRIVLSHPRAASIIVGSRWLRWSRTLAAPAFAAYVEIARPGRLAGCAAIALAAYGLQATLFAGYVRVLWPSADVLSCIGVFAAATLAGAVSMIPGGLGANELAMITLLAGDGMPVADATAVAVGMRLVSLWFTVAVGLATLGTRRVDACAA